MRRSHTCVQWDLRYVIRKRWSKLSGRHGFPFGWWYRTLPNVSFWLRIGILFTTFYTDTSRDVTQQSRSPCTGMYPTGSVTGRSRTFLQPSEAKPLINRVWEKPKQEKTREDQNYKKNPDRPNPRPPKGKPNPPNDADHAGRQKKNRTWQEATRTSERRVTTFR